MSLDGQRPASCLSDFALDRRLASEMDTEEGARADAHLATCARCTARESELCAERDAFAAESLPSALAATDRSPSAAPALAAVPARATTRSRARWLYAGGGALAAAAAVLFALSSPRSRNVVTDDGTRAKGGGAQLEFYVRHQGVVRAGAAGERVAPEDALRFAVTSREPRYVAVFSVDAAHHATVYFPADAPAAALTVAGVDVALPASTLLDDTLGDETLHGVFCREPFAVEPVRAALEAAPDRAPVIPSCQVDTLHVTKSAKAP